MSTTLPVTRSSSIPRLELLKIGSDPEALFVKLPDGVLVPATRFTGTKSTISAWIGADGVSSTAELRPRPSRDVWLHARDIAEALAIINQVVCQKETDVTMVAQPHHAGSPCGGHVHASFVLHDPVAVPVILRGQVLSAEGSGFRTVPAPRLEPTPFQLEEPAPAFDSFGNLRVTPPPRPIVQYREEARAGRAFGLRSLATLLNVFVRPLEIGLYPRDRRDSRTYGGGIYGEQEDAVRTEHPPVALSPGVLKWRIEYRYPSTWLAHPALALAYLGLVKLAVNNYHLPAPGPVRPALAALPAYVDEFLRQDATVVSDDVRSLPRILRFVLAEVQPRLQEQLVRVDFEAWARFLNEGRFK